MRIRMLSALVLAATWAVETHSLQTTLVTDGSPKPHTGNPGFSSCSYFKFMRRRGALIWVGALIQGFIV